MFTPSLPFLWASEKIGRGWSVWDKVSRFTDLNPKQQEICPRIGDQDGISTRPVDQSKSTEQRIKLLVRMSCSPWNPPRWKIYRKGHNTDESTYFECTYTDLRSVFECTNPPPRFSKGFEILLLQVKQCRTELARQHGITTL